jgi:hypothetical protein
MQTWEEWDSLGEVEVEVWVGEVEEGTTMVVQEAEALAAEQTLLDLIIISWS